ncbi:hypothetical protein SNEBB_003988 [Seison nebaliae]|nr:hypothetical protein SNEBB_003988 [Seison nebaliae]
MGILIDELAVGLEAVSVNGIQMNPEQIAAMKNSFILLKEQYKFDFIYFWGKIFGATNEYFLAKGTTKDEMKFRTYLYSLDCVTWSLLTEPTEDEIKDSRKLKGRFTGDPSFEFEQNSKKTVGLGPEATEIDDSIMLKEEVRLACVVYEIDKETFIVPRGAFIQETSGRIYRNRLFTGIPVDEVEQGTNYQHFRPHRTLKKKSLIERTLMNPAIEFMDSIEDDIPKGSWSIRYHKDKSIVIINSFLWPGITFYHRPNTPAFGCIYWGLGEINRDLPFMAA